MIASIPAASLLDTVEGLQRLLKLGQGLPLALPMKTEYDLQPSYVRIGHMMGMDWVK